MTIERFNRSSVFQVHLSRYLSGQSQCFNWSKVLVIDCHCGCSLNRPHSSTMTWCEILLSSEYNFSDVIALGFHFEALLKSALILLLLRLLKMKCSKVVNFYVSQLGFVTSKICKQCKYILHLQFVSTLLPKIA